MQRVRKLPVFWGILTAKIRCCNECSVIGSTVEPASELTQLRLLVSISGDAERIQNYLTRWFLGEINNRKGGSLQSCFVPLGTILPFKFLRNKLCMNVRNPSLVYLGEIIVRIQPCYPRWMHINFLCSSSLTSPLT